MTDKNEIDFMYNMLTVQFLRIWKDLGIIEVNLNLDRYIQIYDFDIRSFNKRLFQNTVL